MEETEIYRGDTFEFDFSAIDKTTGESYIFKEGDILKCALKKDLLNSSEYQAKQVKEISEATDTVQFNFSHDEMKEISTGNMIIEIELTTDGKVYTIYQETIKIKGDVVHE